MKYHEISKRTLTVLIPSVYISPLTYFDNDNEQLFIFNHINNPADTLSDSIFLLARKFFYARGRGSIFSASIRFIILAPSFRGICRRSLATDCLNMTSYFPMCLQVIQQLFIGHSRFAYSFIKRGEIFLVFLQSVADCLIYQV